MPFHFNATSFTSNKVLVRLQQPAVIFQHRMSYATFYCISAWSIIISHQTPKSSEMLCHFGRFLYTDHLFRGVRPCDVTMKITQFPFASWPLTDAHQTFLDGFKIWASLSLKKSSWKWTKRSFWNNLSFMMGSLYASTIVGGTLKRICIIKRLALPCKECTSPQLKQCMHSFNYFFQLYYPSTLP